MEEKHFRLLFWFCVAISGYGMIFLTCLVWLPIPKDNVRFADVILGFITGTLVSSAVSYLLGGTHLKKDQKTTVESSQDKTKTTVEAK